MNQSVAVVPAPQSFEGPAAWLGCDLQQTGEWLYHLSTDEVGELVSAIRHAQALAKPVIELTVEDFPLERMKATISSWVETIKTGRGFVQVRGFPSQNFSEEENALVYWGIGVHMGLPVSQNADGDLLGHVRDTGDDPNDPSIRLYKTRVRQDFHADGSDIIGLMCLHPSKSGGESQLVSSVSIYNEIWRRRPDLAPHLFDCYAFDLHEQQKPGEKPYWVMPICRYENGHLMSWYAEWYIREAQRHDDAPHLTAAQDELVSLYAEIANDPSFHVNIDFQVGDMQFLKNSTILHARGAYEDYPQAERRRHLLRLWLARDDFTDGMSGLRGGIAVREGEAAE